MISQTLQRLIDDGRTTAKELGELAGVSTSTVYRWINGQSQPDFDAIRLLMRHLADTRCQEALLIMFAAGTTWQFSQVAMDLDVNHDGRVDAEDALDAAVEAVKGAALSLSEVRDASKKQGVTSDELLHVIAQLQHVVRQCVVTQGVLVEIGEDKRRRKLRMVK